MKALLIGLAIALVSVGCPGPTLPEWCEPWVIPIDDWGPNDTTTIWICEPPADHKNRTT